jgi:hypothetical protein
MNEYGVLDSIDKLSRHSKAPVPGWCTAGKQDIADWLGLSKRTVDGIIKELIGRGMIIKHPDEEVSGGLKVFGDFYDMVEFEKTATDDERAKIAEGVQKLHTVCKSSTGGCADIAQGGVQELHRGCASSAHGYIGKDSKDINKKINKDSNLFFYSVRDKKYGFDELFGHYVRHEDKELFMEWYGKNITSEAVYKKFWKACTNYKNSSEGAKFPKKIMNFVKVWEADWSF